MNRPERFGASGVGRLLASGAALLVAVAIAGCGGSDAAPVAPEHAARVPPQHAASEPRAPSRADLAVPAAGAGRHPAAPAAARSPQLRHLQAEIVHALAPEGSGVGVMVLDLDTGQVLFTESANRPRPPASLEKLYTSVAALWMLGADARLHTSVLGTGSLGRGGVWHGDLYLRGDGDPTFGDGGFNVTYEQGYGPTAAQLVSQLRAAGIRRVAGYLIADESRFDSDRGGPATGNRPDLPDYGGELSALVFDHGAVARGYSPATFAANELARTARSEGIGVFASIRSGRTPAGARVLATVSSPPLYVLLKLMDVPSDDLFADLLTKQLGYRFMDEGTLAAGAVQISQVLAARYGLRPRVFDGSGLDKADRSSPAELVELLRELWHTPVGAGLIRSLPVVGESGTVAGIATGTPARGRCAAKTGTLDDVTNLAGYCGARGGHPLAFAVMIDGPPNWQAIGSLGSIVGAIAAY